VYVRSAFPVLYLELLQIGANAPLFSWKHMNATQTFISPKIDRRRDEDCLFVDNVSMLPLVCVPE